jgi:prenylcysteine oxidase/farnesylcysteine lyase
MGESSFFGKIWENIKLLWRYGYRSPMTTTALVKQMIDTYLSLYSTVTQWDSVESVSSALNFTDIVAQDSATYLAAQGVGDAFAYEIVESATRVNYGHNLDKIHALEGMCSMAANGAKGIKKGNYHVFKRFLKVSKANVHLNTLVTALHYTPEGRWALRTKGDAGSANEVTLPETYDSVILAAPYHTLTMNLPPSVAPVVPVEYVHLHVTLLSTTSPSANPEYFGLDPADTVPHMMLTTAQGIRAGGPAPEFNSMSYHGRIAPGRDEWVVKIFSEKRIDDQWLSNMFTNVGWVHRKEVNLFPSSLLRDF